MTSKHIYVHKKNNRRSELGVLNTNTVPKLLNAPGEVDINTTHKTLSVWITWRQTLCSNNTFSALTLPVPFMIKSDPPELQMFRLNSLLFTGADSRRSGCVQIHNKSRNFGHNCR